MHVYENILRMFDLYVVANGYEYDRFAVAVVTDDGEVSRTLSKVTSFFSEIITTANLCFVKSQAKG